MNTQDVILGLLHKRPMSGYEIKSRFEMPFSYFFDASYGTIYPALAKLEQQGFITKESVQQEGRPNKNVYSLTDKGRNRFREYMDSPIEEASFRSDFMVRLFFGEYQDASTMAAWIRKELDKAETRLETLQTRKADWQPHMSPTQLLCIDLGIASTRAEIEVLQQWLDQYANSNSPDGDEST